MKLCYLYTESFIYHIATEMFYGDMKEIINEFYTSDYKKYVFNIPQIYKKVIGKMKDENNGYVLENFAGWK